MSLMGRVGLGKRGSDAVTSDLLAGDEYRSSAKATMWDGLGVDRTAGVEGGLTEEAQRRGCGNPDCSTAWAKPWKSRRRPIFEGQWGCGSKCLTALVRMAVKRELSDGLGLLEMPHRHRVPLGLVMLAQGWITHPQLRHALEEQKNAGAGKIGEWLQQEYGVPTETVTRGLSVQWSCPVLTLEGFIPQEMALTMPRMFIEEAGLVPLRIAGSRILYLAFEDHLDSSAAFALQKMSELKVESGLLERDLLAVAREKLLACRFVPTERVEVRDSEQMGTRIAEMIEERQPVGARLVRLHQSYWLRTWLEVGAQSGPGTVPATTEDVADTIFLIRAQA